MKKCKICKVSQNKSEFYKNQTYKDKLMSCCKSCALEYQRNYRVRFPEKIRTYFKIYMKKHRQEPRQRYNSYKCRANNKKHVFALTFNDFMQYWQKPCTYCGDDINTIGLDRINSGIGYTKKNITPCCAMCNRMKLDHTANDFISHCEKILNHTGVLK